MKQLRTTFKRSRTPTASEMKNQSSLEVPRQVRSASVDEIQLEDKRQQEAPARLLGVPQHISGCRSRSVDSASGDDTGNLLEVPSRRFQRRRSSSPRTIVCLHCIYLEEYKKQQQSDILDGRSGSPVIDSYSLSVSDSSSEWEEDLVPECSITVTLSPTAPSPPRLHSPPPKEMVTSPTESDFNTWDNISFTDTSTTYRESALSTSDNFFPVSLTPTSQSTECSPEDLSSRPTTPTRRKSIHRQEAFFAEPTGNSLENISIEAPLEGTSKRNGGSTALPGVVVRDIYLQVPDLRRDRAASVDSSFSKLSQGGKTEELHHLGVSLQVPIVSGVGLRSRSVDIVLPTDEQARYKALAMSTPQASCSKGKPAGGAAERILRSTPDWSETAVNGDHLWIPTSISGDFCYVGDPDCAKHGVRMKCSACNVVCHQVCINTLVDKIRFTCKPTFRDVGIRLYREQTSIQHHWVHRRSEKGKCRQCGKSFQSKLSFSSKEIVAISCSWCKAAYHNKESCFNIQRIGEECKLGVHSSIIVPPSWIIKLPRKGSFKSSLRKVPKKRTSTKKKTKNKLEKSDRTFVVKPIPSNIVTPIIVFINPRSGGNQGIKLLQKFQWLLNPRQVFDLTQGGPRAGLELYRKVPNLRVLACGGDGTAGWVLSVIDQIEITPPPAVGVLPLGTGNDLARALGWGGGYTDEPISKILSNLGTSEVVLLDRWSLMVESNTAASSSEKGKTNLPLNVVNNYFSLGVDAHIALEFHEAREAHPEKFNSRLRNKMFYGQMGGKDLLKRKWKDLAEFVTLECDGKDMTNRLKELKVHAIVFLNISSYGGGTRPWNRSMGSSEPSTDDELIEVVGLTTYQLPLLQAGGHGTCITQCRSAVIVTSRTIPMQVDGEACKLEPAIITLSHLNRAPMLAKRRGGLKANRPVASLDNLLLAIYSIRMTDYEQHHYDKELLQNAAIKIGTIEVNPTSDLEQIRTQLNKYFDECKDCNISAEWCFVDSCTAERFFRIDKAQENLHYVGDIAQDNLYILECGGGTVPQTPEDETAVPSPSSNHHTPYIIPEMKVSDEGSLDSPSDQPPMSPNVIQSPEELPFETVLSEKRNGEKENSNSVGNLKINSITERLFSFAQESYSAYSNCNERPNEVLLKAATIGDLKMVKDLHGRGYSLLTRDSVGQTILHYAARYGHKDIVKYILAYAPTSILEIKDNNLGQTALHKAAAYKWRAVCCVLVARGAALDVTDHRGLTPRQLAIQAEDHELAAYLESQEHFQMVSSDIGTMV